MKPEGKLVVLSVKEFAQKHGFIQTASAVRENENGYPFVTFINKDNVAENVYFSKEASKGVTVGTPVDKTLMSRYQIGLCSNAQGEPRTKLISNSERVSIEDLF